MRPIPSHPADPRLNLLRDSIRGTERGPHEKRRVELLLGTDRAIGRESRSQERRVGITPRHVWQLREFCHALDLHLSTLVVENAGARAGFSDAEYIDAGAEVVAREELAALDGPPDLVHALKEPSPYEAELPAGPFLRLGALHSGDFHEVSGFAGLLGRGDVAVFDGSNIGAAETFRIPIRGRMSVFAGEIAAEWVLEHLGRGRKPGRVVVVGGGYVGRACAQALLASNVVPSLVVVDARRRPERLAALAAQLPGAQIIGAEGLDHPDLLAALGGASGLVLAVAEPGNRAPRVVTLSALQATLAPDAVIVDVSIDERGAIEDPEARPEWASDPLVRHFEHACRPRHYRAIANMPRAYPMAASEAHGDVVTPYLAALLYLAGHEGGPAGVVRRLAALPADPMSPDPWVLPVERVFGALCQDLRNGLAAWPTGGGLGLAPFLPAPDRAAILRFLDGVRRAR